METTRWTQFLKIAVELFLYRRKKTSKWWHLSSEGTERAAESAIMFFKFWEKRTAKWVFYTQWKYSSEVKEESRFSNLKKKKKIDFQYSCAVRTAKESSLHRKSLYRNFFTYLDRRKSNKTVEIWIGIFSFSFWVFKWWLQQNYNIQSRSKCM